MHALDRTSPVRPALWLCSLAGFGLGLCCCPAAPAQERPPLRLDGLYPGGARNSATESWGTFGFSLTNLSDTDRQITRNLLDHGIWPDIAILGHARGSIDYRRRCTARDNQPRGLEGPRGEGISPVRLVAHKQRHSGRRASGDMLVDERRSGSGVNERL